MPSESRGTTNNFALDPGGPRWHQVAPQVALRPWRLPVACAGVHSPTMAGQASPIVTCTNSYSASNDNSNLDAI